MCLIWSSGWNSSAWNINKEQIWGFDCDLCQGTSSFFPALPHTDSEIGKAASWCIQTAKVQRPKDEQEGFGDAKIYHCYVSQDVVTLGPN